MINTKNIYENIIAEEINSLVDGIISSNTPDKQLAFVNSISEVAIPTTKEIEMYFDYSVCKDDSDEDYIDGHNIDELNKHLLDKNILKATMTPETFKSMLLDIYFSGDKSIYGILIIDDERRYNPLHPVVAEMIHSGEIVLPPVFTIAIYTYRAESVSIEFGEHFTQIWDRILDHIRENKYNISGKYAFNGVEGTFSDIRNLDIMFDKTGNMDVPWSIIPIQMQSTGLTYPYYGCIEERCLDYEYEARQLTPMLSGNIHSSTYDPSNYGNTCTGDLPSSVFNSLFCLNNMNNTSLYFHETLHDDYIGFAYTSILYSIDLLYKKDIENKLKNDKPKEEETDTLSDFIEQLTKGDIDAKLLQ